MPTAPAPTPTLALTLHFATADASLPARARAALDAVVAAHPGATFTVNGHADARGDAAFNARLSDLRAAAVAARLQSAGVEAARLHTAAFGATRPAAAGDDPRSLWRNRRVEILVSRGAP